MFGLVFEGATVLAYSGVLLPSPSCMRAFLADIGLFSVLQAFKLDFKAAYFDYHRCPVVNWEEEFSVAWFSYNSSGSAVLDVPALKIERVRGRPVMYKYRSE